MRSHTAVTRFLRLRSAVTLRLHVCAQDYGLHHTRFTCLPTPATYTAVGSYLLRYRLVRCVHVYRFPAYYALVRTVYVYHGYHYAVLRGCTRTACRSHRIPRVYCARFSSRICGSRCGYHLPLRLLRLLPRFVRTFVRTPATPHAFTVGLPFYVPFVGF